jgi:hypothetical protein
MDNTSGKQYVGRVWMLGFLRFPGFLGFQIPAFSVFFGFFLFFGALLKHRRG